MALPKVAVATHELTIPSTGQKIKYRPFLVKEEKLLMMAAEGGGESISQAIKDVLQACTQSKLDIQSLAPFDIEYYFLQLRGKSVGDEIKLSLLRPESMECECSKEKTCNITLNIDDIELDETIISDGKISITGDIGIKLKYPDLDAMQSFVGTDRTPTADEVFKIISDSIEYIWEGDEIYKSRDASKKELNDFIESLNSEQFTKVRGFFEDMPKLYKEVDWVCPECKKSVKVMLEGIDTFFV